MNKPSSSKKHELRLFTRYPQPGETKTRLIPELGEKEAADLQRRMTEMITRRMCDLNRSNIRLTISYSNASRTDMEQWLSSACDQIHFSSQSGADLGERLNNAFQDSFDTGHHQTIIIGTDCPFVTRSIVNNGFRQLRNHDVVIGPAHDGGYYLIGLSALEEQLFANIDWGSETVFEQTMKRARKANLRVKTIDTLRDIDRPEDLEHLSDVNLPE